MFDVCGCENDLIDECLCEAISSYSQECANAGIFVEWQEHELVYELCGKLAPLQT